MDTVSDTVSVVTGVMFSSDGVLQPIMCDNGNAEIEDVLCHSILKDLCNPSISTPDSLLCGGDTLSSYSESSTHSFIEPFVSAFDGKIEDDSCSHDIDIDSAVNVDGGSLCDSSINIPDIGIDVPVCGNVEMKNDGFHDKLHSCHGNVEPISTIAASTEEGSHNSNCSSHRNKSATSNHSIKSTTVLILEGRPCGLPEKTEEEDRHHRKLYETLIASAKDKERKIEEQKRNQREKQWKHEEEISNSLQIWNKEILPNWDAMKTTKKCKRLWWNGLPPSVRGQVWKLAMANDLNITAELYDICLTRAKERIRLFKGSSGSDTDSIGSFSAICESAASRESSVEVIRLDVSRTFPYLGIFQKGGPYNSLLQGLLGAYACYRPDVGYGTSNQLCASQLDDSRNKALLRGYSNDRYTDTVQGMSFIAGVLLLNMDVADAFVCFANLLNQPCQIAFYRMDETLMKAYFDTYEEFLKENLPKLYNHFVRHGFTSSLYLIDWIYTMFAKSFSLDIASRVWDVFFRDGEEFLFRTALGVLKLYQDILLKLDFMQLAEFLTKLPNDLSSDELFLSIDAVAMISNKCTFSQVLARFRDGR